MKRTNDLCISICALIVLFPFIIVIGLLVRMNLGSPILFKQQRPGFKGIPFNIYKFRTMTDKVDQYGKLLSDDLRLTSFGKLMRKFSLDELPQLLNVVKGELSLIGPRPLLMEYLTLYTAEQTSRHDVRPGITGWAQVNGRNAITWEKKFELDVWYVDNQSFLLDLHILWKTFLKVIQSDGINQVGKATVERFKGTINE